jgi:hypothetical protein
VSCRRCSRDEHGYLVGNRSKVCITYYSVSYTHMSVPLSSYLSLPPSVHLSLYLPYPSIRFSFCPSMCPSVHRDIGSMYRVPVPGTVPLVRHSIFGKALYLCGEINIDKRVSVYS